MNAPSKEAAASVELQAVLDNQRKAFRAEGPVSLAARQDRIDRCIALLLDNKDAIGEAVSENGRVIVTGCMGKGEDAESILKLLV